MSLTSNPVETLLSTPIPREVWHYTTIAGLQGIVSSGRIWATDVRFTNDKTEFIHAREIANKYLRAVKPDSPFAFPIDELSRMLDKAFDEGALSPLENEVFIASFSAAGDLMSQWMQYADSARGVSIAFDLRNIRPPTEIQIAVTFAPCVYPPKETRRLIGASLGHFTEIVAELDNRSRDRSWMEGQIRTWGIVQRIYGLGPDREGFEKKLKDQMRDRLLTAWRMTLFDLLRVAGHCKNEAFSAELEWRLAMSRPKNRPLVQKVLYRGARGTIPYLESSLFQPSEHLPIVRIRTGPLCEQNDEIKRILDIHGYKVPIIPSAIPLRDTRNAF